MFLVRGIPGIDVETGSLFADRLVSWRLVAYPSVGKREITTLITVPSAYCSSSNFPMGGDSSGTMTSSRKSVAHGQLGKKRT